MKAARCAPTLCGGKPNDLAADTASYRLNFLAARLDGTENPTKRPPIRRMSDKRLRRGVFSCIVDLQSSINRHNLRLPELDLTLDPSREIVRNRARSEKP